MLPNFEGFFEFGNKPLQQVKLTQSRGVSFAAEKMVPPSPNLSTPNRTLMDPESGTLWGNQMTDLRRHMIQNVTKNWTDASLLKPWNQCSPLIEQTTLYTLIYIYISIISHRSSNNYSYFLPMYKTSQKAGMLIVGRSKVYIYI